MRGSAVYKIALCEDESLYSNEQKNLCAAILDKFDINYQIEVFDSGKEFVHAFVQEQKRYDLLLLDIVMDKPDGLELAHIVRQHDKDAAIIFITSNPDFAMQGYDVNALHYLMKPVDRAVLERLILSDYHNRFKLSFFVFESGEKKIRVPLKNIVYMETVGRRVYVTLLEGTVYYTGKLTALLEKLPKEMFVRCHQSFAVNNRNILEINRRNAITVNGMTIPVSRSYLKDVQKAFLKYLNHS